MLLAPGPLNCSAPVENSAVECRSSGIVGGSERAEFVALAGVQQAAIAQLTIAGGGSCTAVVIAARKALTASHCVPSPESALTLQFDSGTDVPRVVNVSAEPHSTLDLALLTWEVEDERLDWIRPISIDLDFPSDEGDLVQMAGYGFTEDGELGLLRFATERIVESKDATFLVSGNHRSGACFGDSGGPALSRTSDGSVRVVGILSSGASGCADTDEYTRLDELGGWFAERGVAPGPAEELADCGLVGSEGRCFGGSVLSCLDGESPRIERCPVGTLCGFDASAGAFGCVSREMDSCDGLGDLGACEGDERLRCEGGVIVSAPCMACGATCQTSVRSGRAICTL